MGKDFKDYAKAFVRAQNAQNSGWRARLSSDPTDKFFDAHYEQITIERRMEVVFAMKKTPMVEMEAPSVSQVFEKK